MTPYTHKNDLTAMNFKDDGISSAVVNILLNRCGAKSNLMFASSLHSFLMILLIWFWACLKNIFEKASFSDRKFFTIKLINKSISYNLPINSGEKRFFCNFFLFAFFANYLVNLPFPMSIWKLLNVLFILYMRSSAFIASNLYLVGIKIRSCSQMFFKRGALENVAIL